MNAPALARGAEPATDTSVKHLWLAAGHTLCELEHGAAVSEDLRELREGFAAVCGPCLLIVLRLVRQSAAYLDLTDDAVAPQSATEAWRILNKSPWGGQLDIPTFLRTTPDLDARQHWGAVRGAVDAGSVRALVDEIHQVAGHH